MIARRDETRQITGSEGVTETLNKHLLNLCSAGTSDSRFFDNKTTSDGLRRLLRPRSNRADAC